MPEGAAGVSHQRPDQRAPLAGAEFRIGQRADQRITERCHRMLALVWVHIAALLLPGRVNSQPERRSPPRPLRTARVGQQQTARDSRDERPQRSRTQTSRRHADRLQGRTTTPIRFPEVLHERLKEAADERDLSINFLVVKAVEDFLERLVPADEFRFSRAG